MTTDHMEPKKANSDAWPSNRVKPGGDIMLRVAGRRFRCECGANVFHHPEGRPDVYQCNGCHRSYEADDE